MIKKFLILTAFLLFLGCATQSYNTARFRNSDYSASNIAVSEGSFSQAQITAIMATEFPPAQGVSVSYFYTNLDDYQRYDDFDPSFEVIESLKKVYRVSRIVPIPDALMGNFLDIDTIQQIGIRTLSEYSLVLMGDSSKSFFSYKTPAGSYIYESELDFLLIDNRTTAIIATDKLFSEMEIETQLFSDENYEMARKAMYLEQAALLAEKLNDLFEG